MLLAKDAALSILDFTVLSQESAISTFADYAISTQKSGNSTAAEYSAISTFAKYAISTFATQKVEEGILHCNVAQVKKNKEILSSTLQNTHFHLM